MAGMVDEAPTPAPKRLWFRWSLRTVFVVVTVFGCWLGYELNWIRQRHNFLAHQQSLHGAHWSPELAAGAWAWKLPASPPKSAPGLLWILGEEPVITLTLAIPKNDIIVVRRTLEAIDLEDYEMRRTQADFVEAELLFPEAEIIPMMFLDPPAWGQGWEVTIRP